MQQATKRGTAVGLLLAFLTTSGCGYFLYPERVGQTGGRVDPTVVILDGAALLFGIIPGVVSFAVDISTGAIYLPPGEKSSVEKHGDRLSTAPFDHLELQPADSANLPVDRQQLAQQLSQKLGQPVDAERLQLYTTEQSRVSLARME